MLILLAVVLSCITVYLLNTVIVFFGGIYLEIKRKRFERWLNEC